MAWSRSNVLPNNRATLVECLVEFGCDDHLGSRSKSHIVSNFFLASISSPGQSLEVRQNRYDKKTTNYNLLDIGEITVIYLALGLSPYDLRSRRLPDEVWVSRHSIFLTTSRRRGSFDKGKLQNSCPASTRSHLTLSEVGSVVSDVLRLGNSMITPIAPFWLAGWDGTLVVAGDTDVFPDCASSG